MCPPLRCPGGKDTRIRYDDQITTVDVPEEEFTLMIEVDYEQRLEKAKDPSSVQRRSPQDIIDELNKADYNNWHKHNRRWDGEAVPASIYGGKKHISSDVDAAKIAPRWRWKTRISC